MPHGISDSEWARVGAKSIGEYNEKMKEEQLARDSIAEVEAPADIPEIPEEVAEEEPIAIPLLGQTEPVKVMKKRGRPAGKKVEKIEEKKEARKVKKGRK